MAGRKTYYKAELGVTDGANHYTQGMVFPGTEALDAHYAATGGVDTLDRTLYVKASEKEYKEYAAATDQPAAADMVPGNPETDPEVTKAAAEADPDAQVNADAAEDAEKAAS